MAVYRKYGDLRKGKIAPFKNSYNSLFLIMQSMLLAAGFGTRLRPYTFSRPKPLFPVLNRPLLLILLEMLRDAGSSLTVVNGHHLGHQIADAVTGLPGVVFQFEPEILGTGGGVRRALSHFADEPVLVMNGDIFHTIDLRSLYEHHVESGNSVTMALHDYQRFNTVEVLDGRVLAFRPEAGTKKGNLLAFTGIHCINPSVIERIPPDRFHHIIDLYRTMAQQNEKIGFVRVDGSFWQDIGTLGDYLNLHRELLAGSLRKSSLVSGVKGSWLVSDDAQLEQSVSLEGWGCIGRARIGRNVRLRNCVVWDGADIPVGMQYDNILVAQPMQNG